MTNAFNAQPLFTGNPCMAEATAARNRSLRGAHLMLAARGTGHDAFFPDGR